MLLPMKQRSDCRVHHGAPSTITEAMDSIDGDLFPKPDIKPKSNPNPLVQSAIYTPPMPDVVPPPVTVMPVFQPAPVHYSSPLSTVTMDTAEDVKKATANVANLFRSVSLDVDPSQEGPSTAAMSTLPSIEDDVPVDKPGRKRSKLSFKLAR